MAAGKKDLTDASSVVKAASTNKLAKLTIDNVLKDECFVSFGIDPAIVETGTWIPAEGGIVLDAKKDELTINLAITGLCRSGKTTTLVFHEFF